jgi:hypothetical protein
MTTVANIGLRRGAPEPVEDGRKRPGGGRPRPAEGGHKGRPYGSNACIFAALLSALFAPGDAGAQQQPNDQPERAEVWDLRLGTPVEKLPDAFADYACGTNGGPPSIPLTGWRDFRRCRPDAEGLREVYFRYDDELEYWAKANNFATEIEKYSGTKVYDFPVVLSGRFDDGGKLAGLRIVSDPRDPSRDRDEAYLLRNFLTARYGRDGWGCVDLPLAEGETPVARTFIKQRCRKTVDAGAVAGIETHFFRKKGQSQYDPQSGRTTEGQFESLVRFELTQAK